MALKDDILTEKADAGTPLAIDSRLRMERLFPPTEESCELSVCCFRADYSASRIAHAVEDCDAHLLNLNVTDEVTPSGQIVIDLRISHRNGMRVARSLERYGYSVLAVRNDSGPDADTMAERINELMVHLNV